MSKTTKNTGVALSNQFTQDDIPGMLAQVKAQILVLKGDKEKNARITGTLGQFGTVSSITDINILRGAYAYITKKGEAIDSYNDIFKKAAPLAKIEVYKEGGHSVSQWQEEIVVQYKEVAHKGQIEKLERTAKALQDNMTAKDKLAETLKDIAADLND